VKGLPLAYNKDMQETQEPLFEAASTVHHCLKVAAGFMRQVQFNRERMQGACESGFMNAMAAATYLSRKGVPFRQAHEIVAHAVQKCLAHGCELEQLTLDELRELSPVFDADIYDNLKVESVLACHDVSGGTAPHRVQQALSAAKEKLATMQEAHGTHA
jgi:argininosuccinate lyase